MIQPPATDNLMPTHESHAVIADHAKTSMINMLGQHGLTLAYELRTFTGSHRLAEISTPVDWDQPCELEIHDAQVRCEITAVPFDPLDPHAGDYRLAARMTLLQGTLAAASFCLQLRFDPWCAETYTVMPAAVYAGNRFRSKPIPYPPIPQDPEDLGPLAEPLISDVPRLSVDLIDSRIQQLAGDLSTPAMGIYRPSLGQGVWILTPPAQTNRAYGFEIDEAGHRQSATCSLMMPGVREDVCYRHGTTEYPSSDTGATLAPGESLDIACRIVLDQPRSIPAFYETFMAIRTSMTPTPELATEMPYSKAFELLEDKYNRENWDTTYHYYRVGIGPGINNHWQAGWIGGCMATLPLLRQGHPDSVRRSLDTLRFALERGQAPSGLLYGIGDGERWYGDHFNDPDLPWHLIRKSADCLLFVIRHFRTLDARKQTQLIEPAWHTATRKLADALTSLWYRYGQFGQFVNHDTGEILVGQSTCAAIAPAGLAAASLYYDNPGYLEVAAASAETMYNQFTRRGLTTGAPGEILQCADSESAFALLETFIELYDVTGEPIWIKRARDAANQAASWCMPYDFSFPKQTTFAKLDIHSAGSIGANVQNKHGAPGICTLSGLSLLKLFRATDDLRYLYLLQQTARNITQYLCRQDKPIPGLHQGWINERVSTGDWAEGVGEIFPGSCWPEVSAMLVATEIPGVYIQPRQRLVCAFDHVVAELDELKNHPQKGLTLHLHNPTQFSAQITVMIDDDPSQRLANEPLEQCTKLDVAAGQTISLEI